MSEYDSKYLPTYKYVMLLSKDKIIKVYFANIDYTFFIEYPISNKKYNTPLEVFKNEMSLTNSDAEIIYENIDRQFHTIAFFNSKKQ